ncbi:hypothetical protein [Eggerthella sp. YY7918]|uniref:hypothetical protein n=1 Tax=Eggerthella sp. (strain YY7918) TaxID=502558 RepID=UPI0002171429|nr:hypothetical protein [Eggerthella sp. YY7918]BAK44288.1 hypothetical protein EGYY_11130 [Eggerthella sp. YY7918]
MARLKKLCAVLLCLALATMVSGCSALSGDVYYNNVEEARAVMLQQLEEKYQKEFTLTGEERYAYDKSEGCYVFRAKFQDEEGLEAQAILVQKKGWIKRAIDAKHIGPFPTKDDTYSAVFYTKKAIREIEPLFEGEPFEKYVICIDNPRHAYEDLSLTLEEFFADEQSFYWLDIVLPDGWTEQEYTETIYRFYTKLRTKQSLAFELSAYANGSEIFTNYYIDAEGFYPDKTYEDIEDHMMFYNRDPMPADKWMTWYYRIDEQFGWADDMWW